eukprot:scaffold25556_cov70-Phaeocystis_antarctica.AAC.3
MWCRALLAVEGRACLCCCVAPRVKDDACAGEDLIQELQPQRLFWFIRVHGQVARGRQAVIMVRKCAARAQGDQLLEAKRHRPSRRLTGRSSTHF